MGWACKDFVINANLFYHRGYTCIKFAQPQEARKSNFKSITRSEQYHSILLSHIQLNKTANNMPTGRKKHLEQKETVHPYSNISWTFYITVIMCMSRHGSTSHSTWMMHTTLTHPNTALKIKSITHRRGYPTIKQMTNEHVLGKSNFCQPSFSFDISLSLKG